MVDKSYLENFAYTHRNPYHDKLAEFDDFILRDEEGEKFKGVWGKSVFNRVAPLEVEIGSGYGHFMLEHCQNHPEINFIGLDYRFKRSYQLGQKLKKIPTENRNFRYLRAKGERLAYQFADSEVDTLYYFFPDPWPKKRHHKKRLFQLEFLKAAYRVLKPGGKFYIKTDHTEYANWMLHEIETNLLPAKLFSLEFQSLDLKKQHPSHFLASFETKFEKIFLKKNIPIKAFVLKSLKETEPGLEK